MDHLKLHIFLLLKIMDCFSINMMKKEGTLKKLGILLVNIIAFCTNLPANFWLAFNMVIARTLISFNSIMVKPKIGSKLENYSWTMRGTRLLLRGSNVLNHLDWKVPQLVNKNLLSKVLIRIILLIVFASTIFAIFVSTWQGKGN